ncbi:hypothetical protein MASR2M29_09980 [Spirochaetota bacterium]
MILGLTGGYCSGKSSAAQILAADGWQVINVDKLGHIALQEKLDEVAALLGPEAKSGDGLPERKTIGKMVFKNPALMRQYEAIVHPHMNSLLEKAIKTRKADVCIDAAILYRLPAVNECNAVLEIRAPLMQRIKRAKQRDGTGLFLALARIHSQSRLWKMGKSLKVPRLVLRNDSNEEELERSLKKLLSKLVN